ncbi:spore coat putative kinase YutH [Bacillus sp. B15-48]|uniref:spore coat putative kinase YutH n=1 Tax=Bacillus sp. B15-48 TaxID=1548601 RepID=UPI00193FC8DA|nr:spore coat protein YutH [Bacillus sp. B15-48]MBM4760736.1 spore coat protein YutH [Bacillus sp. B15-48]
MFEKMLKEKYGIKNGQEIEVEKYRAFQQENALYLIMNVNTIKEQEISELETIATQLRFFGDKEIPFFQATTETEKICEWEGAKYSVLKYPQLKRKDNNKIGKKLARFHLRGRSLPFRVTNINRIGQWKQLWEKRLDQMEHFWNGKLFRTPENEFEKMFYDSFPYYMGLAENAIQYLTDTELDNRPIEVDHGTVCHERFTEFTWGKNQLIKNPYDWVFDHGSRDLAEWVRARYLYNSQTYQPIVKSFLSTYQQVTRLSPFSWRLLYARLLFPLHYFECIENYYLTNTEQQKRTLEEQLEKYLKRTGDHERFLGTFYQLVEAPIRAYKLPIIQWLIK